MKTKQILLCALAAALPLTACIVPPSMYERASWGPPPDYWQEQGRYRQAGEPAGAAPTATERPPADPLVAGTAVDPRSGVAAGDEAAPIQGAPTHMAPAQPPLYAWDGGIVDGAPQGRVMTQGGTPRGVESPPAGRGHIIELYQQVLDERDALAEEVENLRKLLGETTLALETKTSDSMNLAARVAALEAAHKELMVDNQSIAARLVQAQIRRLEAEKLLLEAHIQVERARADDAARAATALGKPSGTRPRPVRSADEEGHE